VLLDGIESLASPHLCCCAAGVMTLEGQVNDELAPREVGPASTSLVKSSAEVVCLSDEVSRSGCGHTQV